MRYGSVRRLEDAFYGIKPAILAVVVGAISKLAKPVMKSVDRALVAATICAAAIATSVHELLLLAMGTLVGVFAWRGRKTNADAPPTEKKPTPPRSVAIAPALAAATIAKPTALSLFLAFLKIGSILYGSGYVLLAFLRSDLVERRHWLDGDRLLDLVALGQITPGPVFTTATAIGWFLGGLSGAVAATIGIFAPAFVLVGVTHDLVARLRRSRWLGGALDGVNVASLALMAAVVVQLARSALIDVPTWIIAVVAALVAVRTKWNATWSVLGGALAGVVVHRLHLAGG